MTTPKNYLTLVREGSELVLSAYSSGVELGSLKVRSGMSYRQNFRTRANEKTGHLEPVPEGVYNLGALIWAGSKGDYDTLHPAILSPIWVEIIGWPRYIGVHYDNGAPGTAGCVGLKTVNDMKTFVDWVNAYGHFSALYVDWGLGSVELPKRSKEQKKATPMFTVKCKDKEITIPARNGETLLSAENLRELGIGVDWDSPTRTTTLII